MVSDGVQSHGFACVAPIFLAWYVKDTVLFLLGVLGSHQILVEYIIGVFVSAAVHGIDALICVHTLFYCCDFAVSFEIWKCDTPGLVFFSQDSFRVICDSTQILGLFPLFLGRMPSVF